MAGTIQIKRGAKGERESLPLLADGEIGFASDLEGGALFIGTQDGNLVLCSNARTLRVPQKAQNQADLPDTASSSDVIACINSILEKLKTAGVMNSE